MNPPKYSMTKQRVETTFVFLTGLFIVLFLLLRGRLIQPSWMFAGFLLAGTFFYVIHRLEKGCADLPVRTFTKRLFWYSFGVRLLAVVVLVIIAQITWGLPTYVGSLDAVRFFNSGVELSDVMWKEGLSHVFSYLEEEFGRNIDSAGICVILGSLFAITFKSVILGKVLIALVGSLSVLLVYKTASILVEQPAARLAGLMAAFLPVSLFYDAVILKESFVVFLTSLIIFLSTDMVRRGKFTLKRVFTIIVCVSALFFFRVAAGAVIIAVLAGFFLINSIKRSPLVSWTIGLTVVFSFLGVIIVSGQSDFFLEKMSRGTSLQEQRLSVIEKRTTWQNLSGGPVFLALAHYAPFPSLIKNTAIDLATFYGHDQKYYEIAGLIVWNILATFALLGAWQMLRSNPKQTFMVWGYTFGYTLILGFTAMFTQVRLGWNVLPMMMIPAALGIRKYWKIKVFYLALLIAGFLIIAWNVFRAAGRGLL